jgi:hypothetical protein
VHTLDPSHHAHLAKPPCLTSLKQDMPSETKNYAHKIKNTPCRPTMVTTLSHLLPLFLSLFDFVNQDDLITMYLLDTILGPREDENAQNATWSPSSGTPARAQGCPGRARTTSRPDDSVLLSPPFLHPPAPHDTSSRPDTAIGSPAPCRRRRRRRHPPRVLQYMMTPARLRQPLSSP